MSENCTCGSPVSPDDRNCPHCGKPLSPEQAAAEARAAAEEQAEKEKEERRERELWERRPTFGGVLLYTTLISASMAVIAQDLISSATVSAALLSLAVSLWAGFSAVMLFHWKFPGVLSLSLARKIGTLAGLVMMIIAVSLDEFGSLTEWPREPIEGAVAYFQAQPVAARLASSVTPLWSKAIVMQTCALSFCVIHAVAATLGGLVAHSIFRRGPTD